MMRRECESLQVGSRCPTLSIFCSDAASSERTALGLFYLRPRASQLHFSTPGHEVIAAVTVLDPRLLS